jgi:hypothetical protein
MSAIPTPTKKSSEKTMSLSQVINEMLQKGLK